MIALAPVVAHDRLERVLAHTLYVLRELRPTARPGALSGELALIWRRHLGPIERLALASAGMLSLDRDTAETLAEATLCDACEGEPIPPFTNLREEARDWAIFASPGELKAYLAAIWNRLPDSERDSFFHTVHPNRRAA
jgi:hypothetical protein